MKRCGKCKLDKPLEEFVKSTQTKDGRSGHCKACKNSYYRGSAEKTKQRNRDQRERLRARIREWKLDGCIVCGYNRCTAAIDPHHLRDKEINVGYIVQRTYSLERLERELAKCVPLCANCHRELHAGVISLE